MPIQQIKKIAISTGGGDAPGLNAVIRAVVLAATDRGWECHGIRDGYNGLLSPEEFPDGGTFLMTRKSVAGITHLGGTILGTTNRGNPTKFPVEQPDGSFIEVDRSDELVAKFQEHGFDALITVGGDGSLAIGYHLANKGLRVIGVPKTIDNDLSATDFTFGFFSAVEVVTRAMDDLRSTAESHGRVMVVECMGRYAGWITAYAGVAAGAEVVLVPERPANIEDVCQNLLRLRKSGARAAIVAVAEGCRIHENGVCLSTPEKDEFGHFKTGGAADLVARRIQQRIGWESRSLVLGHLQRAGRPIAFDRIFALRLGAKAARLCLERRFGYMAALRAGEVVEVPLREAVAERKILTDQFLDRYETFFLPISSP